MESKYLIEIRRIINSLSTSDVSIKDIYKLQKLEVNLCKRIEKTILNNPGIGKSFLTTTLRELLKEHQYVELKIKSKLKELQQNGYESNDEVYANTIEVINNFEDLIQSLAKTDKNYFINQIISITEVKQNIETEPTIVNEKTNSPKHDAVIHETPNKNIPTNSAQKRENIINKIQSLLSEIDRIKGWESIFFEEKDYLEYRDILVNFFSDPNFKIPQTTIKTKNKTISKLSILFKGIHEHYSEMRGHLLKDYRFHQVVRILNEWKDKNPMQIYKAIYKG